MHITTNKHAMDPRYRETFRQPVNTRDYYKNKKDDLDKYRMTWTKKDNFLILLIHMIFLIKLLRNNLYIILLLSNN